MKYLIINDEHELYEVMFEEAFRSEDYDVSEVDRLTMTPGPLDYLRRIHFSERINRHIWLPGKGIWNRSYALESYPFDPNERYWLVFLNGTLRLYYSKNYLMRLRRRHGNVKLALLMYDSSSNPSARRAFDMAPLFDAVFSFDEGDCERYGFQHFYSTLSFPSFVRRDEMFRSGAFFVGTADNRLPLMLASFKRLSSVVNNPLFVLASKSLEHEDLAMGVQISRKGLPYRTALSYSYNTDLVVEIVKPGQSGITLRTCEAILFNKKLLTNNVSLQNMPFFDSRYMSVFESAEEIDLGFVCRPMDVRYERSDWFSPLRIIRKLDELPW